MNVSEKQDFINDLAALLQTSPSDVTPEFALNDENWDSVAIISAIALIDKHFSVTVPAGELATLSSAGQLMQLIERSRPS